VEQERMSPLKCQTRCISASPDGRGFVVGSTEGRVAVEYLAEDEGGQSRKYAFKCHRQGDLVFPVNALAFHPVYGTFASGGADGVVNIWDGENRKRLSQFHQYPTSVADVCFSHDGGLLAIAASYTFERGQVPHPADNVYIRTVAESDAKPRKRAAP